MNEFCKCTGKWFLSVAKKWGPMFAVGFGFAILCFVGINAAMAPVSKSEYCGGRCHEMNTAYQSWELSVHAANKLGIRAECIDCHLPPKDKFFRHLAAKIYAGGKDMYKHYRGEPYDAERARTKVLKHISDEGCLNCHDSLLTKPGSQAARKAHMEAINAPETTYRCVDCHEHIAHERQRTLFSI